MFRALGRFLVRRRNLVLVSTLVVAVAAAIAGAGVFDRLSAGGFENDEMESARAGEFLLDNYGIGDPNIILLVSTEGSVNDPDVVDAGLEVGRRLADDPDVEQVVSYWTAGRAPALASDDGSKALVVGRILGDEDQVDEAIERLSEDFAVTDGDPTVGVGGFAEIYRQMNEQIESDLRTAELITLPIVLILLLLVFGSAVSASLPLVIGGLAIVGTFFVLSVIASITQVSVFSINLTTAMGLGLAIDYSLFIVSRYREELHGGADPHEAVVRTVDTAGRTVTFSALTVAISLSALLVFPLPFLRSFAYAGIPVVLLSAAGSVVSLSAGLAVLGHRVDALTIFRRRPPETGEGMWHRIAVFVMKRPWPIAIGVTALLLFLAVPFLDLTLGLPDDRSLPKTTSSRQVQDAIREDFSSVEAGRYTVVLTDVEDPAAADSAVGDWTEDLSALEGVARVEGPAGIYAGGTQVVPPGPQTLAYAAEDGSAWLAVVPSVDPYSERAQEILEAIRESDAPGTILVGGQTALLVDARDSLLSRLPLALGIIAVVTFVLLFLMTGSILVPVKAIILNVLSLTATFGAMVWVFQQGNLAGTLDFTPTGWIDLTIPILMFCIAFGLSMDYEVFLLSRIKEEYDLTGDNESAVATGLERTGRIVTAAAVLLAVVFFGFGLSKVTFIKLFGFGLALAVLVDATLVRATLVPAFMRLAGKANWWAPRPLRRLHDMIGLSESGGGTPRAEGRVRGGEPAALDVRTPEEEPSAGSGKGNKPVSLR